MKYANALAVLYLVNNVSAVDVWRQATQEEFDFINSKSEDFPVQLQKAAKEKNLKQFKMPKGHKTLADKLDNSQK